MARRDRRSWRKAYRLMGYTFREYLFRLMLPLVILSILVLCISIFLSDILGPMRYLMYALALLLPSIGIFYPKIWVDRKRREIEQNIPLFITDAGVLATANVEKMEIFRSLARKKEVYGPLAEEMEKIVVLVDTWHLSFAEACRYVSERTPSDILANFLMRLSNTMEAGEEVGRFLLDEQSVVMSDYESMYNSSLDKMRDIRDLFLSIIVSSVFLVVLSIVMPFVVGLSPFTLIGIGALVFVVSEVGFILGAEFIMPDDPIWLESSMKTSRDRRIKNVQILSLTLFSGLVVFSVLHLFFGIFPSLWSPLPVYLALPLTPLALPGFIVWWEEKRIRNKDSGFPGFLRTLSASASAKQATAVDVLGIFKGDEFGVLAPDVENLHKRLRIRIDEKLSWDYFFADTGSHLIERFGNMYFEGVTKGGDPKTVGDVITENFKRILRIREKRYGFVSSLIGVLYGVAVIAAATFFIGFCFVNEMIEGVEEVIGEFGEAFRVFRVGVYDIPGVHFMLTGLILANALLITFYIRAVGSSHDIGYYAHAVILLWLGIVTGLVVERFMGQLIAV